MVEDCVLLIMENIPATFSKAGYPEALSLSTSLFEKSLQKTVINVLNRME